MGHGDPSRYFLITERLGFRTWSPDDLDLALGLWGDPAVTALIDARGSLSPAEVAERLDQEVATAAAHGIQYWPIFLRDGDEHVGCCGLRPYRPQILELGFHIRSGHWGRGLASEAARAVIAYGFDELDAQGLFAGHNPANQASRHLLEKLGFRHIGDELYQPTGLLHPSYRLGRDEYLAGR